MISKKLLDRFKRYKKEDYGKASIELHKSNRGKISIKSNVSLRNYTDLSIAYSPGVAEPCLEIVKDEKNAKDLVINGHTVAVITDGSSVLGLGNIGPKASLPVMEGKSALFLKFANINSFPLAIDTQNVDEFVNRVKNLAPSFAGINLEDISAPRCFEIEKRLKKELDIPVFHDDQHGTAIVALAGLINSLKLVNKKKEKIKIVINGSGAAGIAVAKLFAEYGCKDIIVCDSKGVISKSRKDLNDIKKDILKFTNKKNHEGKLKDVMTGCDVFVGVSKADLLTEEDVRNMGDNPIIFALANPNPEINPDLAYKAGAKIVATGRSDYPNQINNVLVFPGIFKGAIEADANDITENMKLEAAKALANLIKNPNPKKILPKPFDKGVCDTIAGAVRKQAKRDLKKKN